MRAPLPLLGSLLLLAAGCSGAPAVSPADDDARAHVLDEAQAIDTVHLALGESIRVHPADLILRFAEVLNDSRCRPDVQCVWAGSVRVRLVVALAAGGAENVVLETNPPTASATASTTAAGYRLTLLPEVSPPPGESGRYRIALEIARL